MEDYIYEYDLDIKEDIDKLSVEQLRAFVSENIFKCVYGTFTNIDVGLAGLILTSQNTLYKKFLATKGDMSTDWILDTENVGVHGIYVHKGEELKINFIYKDKTRGFNLKRNYFYMFPYWLTHRFESTKEEECAFFHFRLPFEKRLITKDKKVWW
jgi:hypothetical protein